MAKISFTNDIISDVLTRIRNAMRVDKPTVTLPNVKMVLELLKVLANSNMVESYAISDEGELVVNIKVDNQYKFTTLKRISKPGVRRYVALNEIRPVKGGRGILILSTSKGVVSGNEAKKLGVGGEVLCEIW